MDKYGNIYRDLEENIPSDDKARLDGYLHAKADDGEAARQVQQVKDEMQRVSAELDALSRCICPSHASNRGECPVHDDKGRVRGSGVESSSPQSEA